MGRRTVWWRGRTVLACVAALCTVAALPAQAQGQVRDQRTAAGTPDPYVFAGDAQTVEGAPNAAEAVRLTPGRTYKSSVRNNGKLYYRLRLDSASNAYVSATAVPRLGTNVTYSDGIKVSLQDPAGRNCFSGDADDARFGPTESPRPLTAWASRRIGPDGYACQTAGTYSVVVERISGAGSSADDWDLELQYVSEPVLKTTGPSTAPETWNSASPEAIGGAAQSRKGGTSFNEARGLEQGVWKDGIRAGQTLFYRVPVDWGQQLYATAELGGADGDGILGNALVMSLYNPVRAFVDDARTGYGGRPKPAALEPLPAVAYENRYDVDDQVSGMRFAGWYYLAVHLGADVADKFGDGPIGLTLRVRVSGAAGDKPVYAGAAEPPGVFDVTAGDKDAAESGAAAADGRDGGDGNATMKLVAAGGIGAGTVLVLGLGVWTVVARRRAAGTSATTVGAASREYEPPRAR
ncbi:hypothetical protein G5C60_14850 [Streptomyces sp. HC44]|uniref:Uncharacterized protein n=1 Tax=Streptomyces scabichelini TaxID=2711217 RepID=A0A6G4V487_9ACTN|nr:hypothetical protein [Streptomyces scabichelini]NGO08849.1 hypothetical protein [Streptomyces scabichelini]